MASPSKSLDPGLQNSSSIIRSSNTNPLLGRQFVRNTPVLPPRPTASPAFANSYMPCTNYGYGGVGAYSSYGVPYRGSLYNSYGSYGTGYNSYGMYGYPNSFATPTDAETRFIQYAEESSRHTFANVESIVRAFNSLAMMLDNTFFAMTSSFRAVLSVAENFGRLRNMFGQIWYSVNIFRFFIWLYRKLMYLLGVKVNHSPTSVAWKQAAKGTVPSSNEPKGSSWPTVAFLGVLLSAPYIISKFLPKYEDKSDPANWKTPGVKAKAVFDFVATTPNELTLQMNDEVTLAPTYIQEEMGLKNTGWAFAVCNGRSGVVPLNYLVLGKPNLYLPNTSNDIPIPRASNGTGPVKTHTKRVSFGENQVFENVDLEDYVTGKKTPLIDKIPPVEKKVSPSLKNNEKVHVFKDSSSVTTVGQLEKSSSVPVPIEPNNNNDNNQIEMESKPNFNGTIGCTVNGTKEAIEVSQRECIMDKSNVDGKDNGL